MAQSIEHLLAENERLVLGAEMRANVRRLTAMRLVVAFLGLGLVLVEGAPRTTQLATVAYVGVGVALFFLSRASDRARDLSAWAVPFIDVPIVAFTQWTRLEERASSASVAVTAACLHLGFVVLVSLALSTRLVLATAIMGLVAFVFTSLSAGLTLVDLDLAIAAFVFSVGVVWWSASRVRPLALTVRRQAWAGRYKMGQRLGAGGMAEVFSATHVREDGGRRQVALKRMLPALAAREDMQAMFLRELELASMMTHPNIVQVLDTGADDEGPFLVMEFVEGGTLSRILKRASSRRYALPPEVCFELSEQLLRAVEHIHTRKGPDGAPLQLVHRDLNPPNVLVTLHGELKVSDFGIARPALDEGMTGSGVLRGKVMWAAPEQLAGEPLSSSVDLFAVGLILGAAALGRHVTHAQPPFPEKMVELLPHLPSERPELGAAWWTMVQSLLEPEPSRRCPSATHALRSLRSLTWDVEGARAQLASLVTDDSPVEQPTLPA